MDPVTGAIVAGGGLVSGLAQMFGQRAMQREQIRRDAELRKGEQLQNIYQQEAAGKQNAFSNLMQAYRSALGG
jgi:hypothetical protein